MAVLTANFCRLQESLRSLEEYSKIIDPDLSRQFERIRYAVYTLQRMTRVAEPQMGTLTKRLASAKLCLLVAGTHSTREFAHRVLPLAASGTIDVIQLRDKSLDDRKLLRRARVLREITAKYGILFIMNDRSDLALLSDADGVHLGQREIPVGDARRILGSSRLIGVSTHEREQAEAAVLAGADYLGAGPVFPSPTKSFAEYPGPDYLREIVGRIPQPIFAIGGITITNLPEVLATGASRVAVASAITESDRPVAAAESLRAILDA
ncbi:MAG: thiamine phosphate synthase, partial [Planctomycetia bacterium]|nr:thiamine phosphate synthase [Planctomycetia bacterium]